MLKLFLWPWVIASSLSLVTAKVSRPQCIKDCENRTPGYRLVECRKSICLMKQISYNWRELPMPVLSLNAKDISVPSAHPCCLFPKQSDNDMEDGEKFDAAYEDKCQNYKTFSVPVQESSSISPIHMELDVSVLQLRDIEETRNRITLIFWVDISYYDDRLKLCDCEQDEDNINKGDGFVIGSKIGEKWWTPDVNIWESLHLERIESLTNKRFKMQARKFAGHTFVTFGAEMVVTSRCLFNITKFPTYKNRCRLRIGSYAWNSSFIKYEMKKLRGEAVPRQLRTTAEFYYLHDKDRFLTVQRPRVENFTYDGFEVLIWRAAPIGEEFKVLQELQKFPFEIAVVLFIISGYPHQQERSGYIANIVSATIIYLVRIPTGMISLKAMNPEYWEMLTKALNTILAGFIGFFVVIRMRADGILSVRDQRRLEFVVAACLVIINFVQRLDTETMRKSSEEVETRKVTCDNFVYDDHLY